MASVRSAKRAAKAMSKTKLPEFDKYEQLGAVMRAPTSVVRMLDDAYGDARGGAHPRALREDFCRTFANCCAWVRLGPERRAAGVDVDPEPIAYGLEHDWAELEPSEQERVQVLQEDVRSPDLPKADVIAALNSSVFGFKPRPELVAYLRNCRQTLESGGVLVLECLGGPGYRKANVERRNYEGFSHLVEQESFDPVTHETRFHLHFHRKGEKRQLRTFSYDWRIWTVPELKDALLEAGFAGVRTYWEDALPWDPRRRTFALEDQAKLGGYRWLSFVVGLR